MLKIGWTREHPNIRASALSGTSVPTPFIVECAIITHTGSKLEKKIHEHLKDYRLQTNKEFFRLSKSEAINILTHQLNLEILTDLSTIKQCVNKHKIKIVGEILNSYDNIEKKINKINQPRTTLMLNGDDNNQEIKFSVHYIDKSDDSNSSWIDRYYWDDDRDGIKYKFWDIINDLKYYKDCIKRGFDNIKETIEQNGRKQFNSDNLFFKKQITETQMNLDTLLSKIDITNII
jgi:hypothetical protein